MTFLTYATTYWISNIVFIIRMIFNGDRRLFAKNYDPVKLWNYLSSYNVSMLFIAPSHLLQAANLKPTGAVVPKSLEIVIAGSPVSEKQMRSLNEAFKSAKVYLLYGITELGGQVSSSLHETFSEKDIKEKHIASCGTPYIMYSYKIVDVITRKPLPHGQAGELLVKADCIMKGYYKMDSSDAFEDSWFKTGDVFMYHPDGCFYYVDRIKEMFKYRGWHVQPVVVEEVINRHPSVLLSIVVGIPHPEDGDHPLALVVLKEGCQCEPSEIEEFANPQLEDSQQLRAGVRMIKNALYTPSGKIKRIEMRQLAIQGKL